MWKQEISHKKVKIYRYEVVLTELIPDPIKKLYEIDTLRYIIIKSELEPYKWKFWTN